MKRGQDRGGRLDRLAVDRDPAILDHAFDLAARGDARTSEEFRDTLRFATAL
jgi:hypothetical protein